MSKRPLNEEEERLRRWHQATSDDSAAIAAAKRQQQRLAPVCKECGNQAKVLRKHAGGMLFFACGSCRSPTGAPKFLSPCVDGQGRAVTVAATPGAAADSPEWPPSVSPVRPRAPPTTPPTPPTARPPSAAEIASSSRWGRPEVLPGGTRVTVRGLQGAAQHNGKSGEVNESNAATGRYTVQLDDGEVLRLKPENLLQSCSAELTGIERKPELNGREGRVTGWDASGGRYHVSLDGQVVSVKPDNLILPQGARATVVGLVSQPRWNGSTCKVISFDRERRRYTVQMKDESTHLALKLESLRL